MWEWWKCLCSDNRFSPSVRSRQTNFGCDITKTNWTKSSTTNIIILVYFNPLLVAFTIPIFAFGKKLSWYFTFAVKPGMFIKPTFYTIMFKSLVETSRFLIYVWSQEATGRLRAISFIAWRGEWSLSIRVLISCVNFLQLKLFIESRAKYFVRYKLTPVLNWFQENLKSLESD